MPGSGASILRKRDALLLPAAHLLRIAPLHLANLQVLQNSADPLFDFRLGLLRQFQTERDILVHGHVGPQRVRLKDQAQPALRRWYENRLIMRRNHLAINQNVARVRLFQPGNHSQHRRLAAARRTQQRDKSAWLDDEIQIVNRFDLAEMFTDVF